MGTSTNRQSLSVDSFINFYRFYYVNVSDLLASYAVEHPFNQSSSIVHSISPSSTEYVVAVVVMYMLLVILYFIFLL